VCRHEETPVLLDERSFDDARGYIASELEGWEEDSGRHGSLLCTAPRQAHKHEDRRVNPHAFG